MNIREGPTEVAKDGELGAAAGVKDGEASKDAVPAAKSKSRKASVASGPGVPDPLKHLAAPTGYPDAEEYIQVSQNWKRDVGYREGC